MEERASKKILIIEDEKELVSGLPAGGGFYVLENLKTSINTSDIPVLVLTAQQGVDLEERAKKAGAVAYSRKPFDPETLLNQIKDILNK